MTRAAPLTPQNLIDPARQSPPEEFANALTHGLGLLLSLMGGAIVVTAAAGTGSRLCLVTASVFSLTLVMVFLASTGFHLARHPLTRRRWQLFDHISIYALIAGTYTPVCLVAVGGVWGWGLFAAIWAQAVAGVTMKLVLVGRYDSYWRFDTALYLMMGWTAVVAIGPIWSSLSAGAIILLALGGAAYTIGCGFFLWERLRFNHAIWHLFVLAGGACHYLAVLHYVVPQAG